MIFKFSVINLNYFLKKSSRLWNLITIASATLDARSEMRNGISTKKIVNKTAHIIA